jgi:drug/metabolite transporter (DMT)-like permease
VIGALWAAASGVGFGLFQAMNRRAGFRDPYVATFAQLVMALVFLLVVCVAFEDLGRLGDATAWSLVAFALAGVVHFMVGSTLLNVSQARVGAARTAPLLTTTPLFGLVIAAVTLGEIPSAVALVGIAIVVAGAFVLSRGDEAALRPSDAVWGLATALTWAISPILIVEGLEGLDAPLLGVTVGMVAAVLGYAVLLAVLRISVRPGDIASTGLGWQMAPGVLVAAALWWRYLALGLTSVGVVLTLTMLSVPVVLFLAPLISGRQLERVDLRIWTGALLVVGGAIVLILAG